MSLTFQKILPMYILRVYVRGFYYDLLLLCGALLLVNLLVSGSLSLTALDLRSVIVLTSIANNIWLFSSILLRFTTLILFVVVYSILLSLLFSSSNKIKCISLVSLRGLPPFPMFFLKLFIVYGLVSFSMFARFHVYSIALILGTLLVSLSYIRLVVNYILRLSF